MGLASNLRAITVDLVTTYGNTYMLSKVPTKGVYDPDTDTYGETNSFTPVEIKCFVEDVTVEELESININGMYGEVTSMATVHIDDNTKDIDETYLIDGKKIHKVIKTTSQDTDVVIKAYFG